MAFGLGNIGDLMTLQQKAGEAKEAFAQLRAAIDKTDFDGQGASRFQNILSAIDKIVDILKCLQGMKSQPQVSQAATSGLADVQSLRKDVAAGTIESKDEMTQRVDDLLAKHKDQLGPLGSMLG